MRMEKCFIYGAGGHAAVVLGTAGECGFEVDGFIDDFSHGPERIFLGKRVFSNEAVSEGDIVFMGFGNNLLRQRIACDLLKRGVRLPSLIHPSAVIAKSAEIEEGTFLGANVVVDPFCHIGRFCILNNGAVVCHQTLVGEAANLCPGVNVAGNVEIADRVWVGIGSTIIEKIKIAADVFIGGGSVVVNDIAEENSLYFGVPAKIQKRNYQ